MSATPPLTREHSPLKLQRTRGAYSLGFARQAVADWLRLQDLRAGSVCTLDGNSLDIAEVVAVAKHGANTTLTSDGQSQERIQKSIQTLDNHLRNGHLVYGVTTGFGGSADSRTTDTVALQRALVQHQNAGVLTSTDIGRKQQSSTTAQCTHFDDFDAQFDRQSMPTSWVRASMLIRCNTIIRGHSAVRECIADAILQLVRHEITPVVPLRGSVSASGDLSPLSYIAGALEGSPDIFVRVGKDATKITTADKALKYANIEPIVLRAKEGLGLLNGTAVSAATASLALHQTQQFAVLSQMLTAMGTEAMEGTAESFYPRIAEMRPHPGQIEAAANILSFLQNSKLALCVESPKDTRATGLYQDRYALRTSSQWIGPQLEDLHHAHEQLLVELNSTTDNPLIDTENDHILHGGNFQAAVVTSTMDRTRLALDKFGRMLFSQASELINPHTNKGLPANLSSDDPSLSFTCKGIDINMASYTSELGFLANPVGNHVNSAEMHNQSLNSVALISSRHTFQALDTMRILTAAYIFTVCQALDLRVQQVKFQEEFRPRLLELVADCFPLLKHDATFADEIWSKFSENWPHTMTLDLSDRASKSIEALAPTIISHLASHNSSSSTNPLDAITTFTKCAPHTLIETYQAIQTHLDRYRLLVVPTYLGNASRAVYTYVRSHDGLDVSFHRGLVEHPTQPKPESWSQEDADARKTIGSRISVIYESIRDGRLNDVVMRFLMENSAGTVGSKANDNANTAVQVNN